MVGCVDELGVLDHEGCVQVVHSFMLPWLESDSHVRQW
jgi:hypothetical protein